MGTMEKIRQTSPYALALFAVVFIGFMVISDTDISTIMGNRHNYQTSPIAIVNGEEILYKDFNDLVQQRIEQMHANSQEEDIQIDEKQIRDDIWKELIEKTILKQEAEKAGIFVSDGDILDIMIEQPPSILKQMFTDSAGNFNKTAYLDILTNPDNFTNYLGNAYPPEKIREIIANWRTDILNIESYIREQKLNELISGMVNNSETILSPEYVKERYIAENSSVSVDYIFLDVNSVPNEQVNISNEELRKYYEFNKRYYEQKPVRKVRYVRIPLIPSYEDTLRAEKRIERIKEELEKFSSLKQRDSVFDVKMSEYGGITNDYIMVADLNPVKINYLDTLEKLQVVGPVDLGSEGIAFFRLDDRRTGENETVKASHILINFNNNKDSAKAEANNILKLAKSNNDFAELATEYSQDKGSAVKGGDLGFFGKGRMVKEFEDAAFSANPGQIVGPVESQFGYHIIKVFEKKSEEIKYSEIIIKPTITTATKNKLFRDAYSLQRQAEEGIPFDTLIFRLKLIPGESNFVDRNQTILGSNYLTHLAFENPVGTVLKPIELDKYGIIVMQVIDAKQGGFKEFETIQNNLKEELQLKKKLDYLEKKANTLYNRLRGLNDINEITNVDTSITVRKANNMKKDGNIPGIGIDNIFTTKAFILPQKKISEPIRGERGYYIMMPYDRTIANVDLKNKELIAYKLSLQEEMKKRAYYEWISKIKETAIIEDFRYEFYTNY
jgi:peptidyl-prolyl cis-trans isomerase D